MRNPFRILKHPYLGVQPWGSIMHNTFDLLVILIPNLTNSWRIHTTPLFQHIFGYSLERTITGLN